jgi:hypothetical protein
MTIKVFVLDKALNILRINAFRLGIVISQVILGNHASPT